MYSEAVGTYYRISIQILFLSLLASYHCVAFTMSSRHLFGTGTTIARAPSNTFIANTVSESAANGEVSKPPFPSELASYEFLDAGAQMRFEKFGKLTVARSCISATRDKSIPRTEWASADLTYEGVSGKVGMWTGDMSKAEDWRMRFQHIVLGLAPSEMGQVGVFPEQHKNWDWTSKKVKNFYQKRSSTKPLHILNAFAYTGAATIACCVAPTVQVTPSNSLIIIQIHNSFILFTLWMLGNKS